MDFVGKIIVSFFIKRFYLDLVYVTRLYICCWK